jgi:glycine cleavage system aminomethyltransferase T
VSSLAFLSVDAAADRGGVHPVAKSAIEWAQRDLGATFEERGGWSIPTSLPGEAAHLATVGVADLSHLGKLEVRTDPAQPGWAYADTSWSVWYRISPRRVLVVCPTAEAARLRDTLREQEECSLVLDATGAYSVIAIVGPEAGTVLRRMTHIHHFPAGGEIAHVQGHVLERGGGYWVICAQELGQYMWEVAVDRASALGGGPVGVDALGRSVG